jgi:hypothetical protein
MEVTPGLKPTFPERPGMSVSGLNFPLEHISKNGGYASKYDEETRESKFDEARCRERKQEWRGL